MGIEIDKRVFTPADYQSFSTRIDEQLGMLSELLDRPGFGQGSATIGSELELYLVDASGAPAYLNQEILASAKDPQLTLELDRYNLEYNLSPALMSEKGFAATEQEILDKLSALRLIATEFSVEPVPIGILPTLQRKDFGPSSMTDRLRYHALVEQLMLSRGSEFEISIGGTDPLEMRMSDITLEGANTSFQVHWRVNPEDFASTYNAVQLVTPLALALAANSPGIFGHDLWDETRIPLFKQSIDTRHVDPRDWHEPARVSFGQGWLRNGALELFAQSVRLFPPLLPATDDQVDDNPSVPELAELRLHQSTVWLWNRPVYDDADGGHLRIELRALPAGPTAADMVAGAAFAIGLAQSLRHELHALLPALPFGLAERNFYRSAQMGIDADIIWPSSDQHGLQVLPVREIIESTLPMAAAGLDQLGVSIGERDRYLDIIEQRCRTGQTGARWQRAHTNARQRAGESREEALRGMLQHYRELSKTNEPVSGWSIS